MSTNRSELTPPRKKLDQLIEHSQACIEAIVQHHPSDSHNKKLEHIQTLLIKLKDQKNGSALCDFLCDAFNQDKTGVFYIAGWVIKIPALREIQKSIDSWTDFLDSHPDKNPGIKIENQFEAELCVITLYFINGLHQLYSHNIESEQTYSIENIDIDDQRVKGNFVKRNTMFIRNRMCEMLRDYQKNNDISQFDMTAGRMRFCITNVQSNAQGNKSQIQLTVNTRPQNTHLPK